MRVPLCRKAKNGDERGRGLSTARKRRRASTRDSGRSGNRGSTAMCTVSRNWIVSAARTGFEAPRLMKRRSTLAMTLRSQQGGEEVTLPMRKRPKKLLEKMA